MLFFRVSINCIIADESLVEIEEQTKTGVDSTYNDLHVCIDGNVEFDTGTVTTGTPTFGGKIKINISKPLPALPTKEPKEVTVDSEITTGTFIDPSQPLPPGEEPVQLNLKPTLQGVELKRLPPVEKGRELTGLCSIMWRVSGSAVELVQLRHLFISNSICKFCTDETELFLFCCDIDNGVFKKIVYGVENELLFWLSVSDSRCTYWFLTINIIKERLFLPFVNYAKIMLIGASVKYYWNKCS